MQLGSQISELRSCQHGRSIVELRPARADLVSRIGDIFDTIRAPNL